MTYRKILVPFSGSDRDAGILSVALDVTKQFDAFCQVVFIRPEPYQALPYLGDGSPGLVVPEVIDSMNQAAQKASDTIRKALAQAARDNDVELIEGKPPVGKASVRYQDIEGEASDVAARASWLSDLAIFVGGRSEAAAGIAQALIAVLLNAQRPVLVLPQSDYAGSVGRKAAIAWDGSAEAASAVRGALPFLKRAHSVKVLSAQENLSQKGAPYEISEVLGEYLDLHTISHSEAFVDPMDKAVGEVLLDQVGIEGCDLLVMGGYGHSRVREMLLGGVTQYILENATIPVLMAH